MASKASSFSVERVTSQWDFYTLVSIPSGSRSGFLYNFSVCIHTNYFMKFSRGDNIRVVCNSLLPLNNNDFFLFHFHAGGGGI